jgi:hypothetical protein
MPVCARLHAQIGGGSKAEAQHAAVSRPSTAASDMTGQTFEVRSMVRSEHRYM